MKKILTIAAIVVMSLTTVSTKAEAFCCGIPDLMTGIPRDDLTIDGDKVATFWGCVFGTKACKK